MQLRLGGLSFIQGQIVNKWQSQAANPGPCYPKLMLLELHYWSCFIMSSFQTWTSIPFASPLFLPFDPHFTHITNIIFGSQM